MKTNQQQFDNPTYKPKTRHHYMCKLRNIKIVLKKNPHKYRYHAV